MSYDLEKIKKNLEYIAEAAALPKVPSQRPYDERAFETINQFPDNRHELIKHYYNHKKLKEKEYGTYRWRG